MGKLAQWVGDGFPCARGQREGGWVPYGAGMGFFMGGMVAGEEDFGQGKVGTIG